MVKENNSRTDSKRKEEEKMANLVPTRIKIGDKWYRTSQEADGTLNFKDDLNYHGSTTQIEYTAQKPNPVLHPSLFHVFNMNGGKVGEFYSDPQISCSGAVSAIDIDKGESNGSSNYASPPPKKHFPKNLQNAGVVNGTQIHNYFYARRWNKAAFMHGTFIFQREAFYALHQKVAFSLCIPKLCFKRVF